MIPHFGGKHYITDGDKYTPLSFHSVLFVASVTPVFHSWQPSLSAFHIIGPVACYRLVTAFVDSPQKLSILLVMQNLKLHS
jgi:hypothetical protein